MWRCKNNQDVGLEAATIERVRNSSLVECRRAENVPGLSGPPKLRKLKDLVEERSQGREAGGEPNVERCEERMSV